MRTVPIENVSIFVQPEDRDHVQRVLLTLVPDLGKLEKSQWLFGTKLEDHLHPTDLVIFDASHTDLCVGLVMNGVSQGAVFMEWMDHGSLGIYHKGKFIETGAVERGEVTKFKKYRLKAKVILPDLKNG